MTDKIQIIPPARFFSNLTKDVAGEQLFNARQVGVLQSGRMRLEVESALTRRNDAVDNFSFNLMGNSKIGFRLSEKDTAQAGKLRYELLDRSGRVIADSAATSGRLKDNFEAARRIDLQANAGTYYVRITRNKGVKPTEQIQYFLNINVAGTTARNVLNTVETPPDNATEVGQRVLLASSVANNISALFKDPRDEKGRGLNPFDIRV